MTQEKRKAQDELVAREGNLQKLTFAAFVRLDPTLPNQLC
jgi:hypothetical protein